MQNMPQLVSELWYIFWHNHFCLHICHYCFHNLDLQGKSPGNEVVAFSDLSQQHTPTTVRVIVMLVLKRANVNHDSSYLFWENIECVTSLNHPLIVIKKKIKGLFEATTILHDDVHASVSINRKDENILALLQK